MARMQQLAQMPEVKDYISAKYASLQRSHQEKAYYLNTGFSSQPSRGTTHDTAQRRTKLYQHPVIEVYINQLGQSLVPVDSSNYFTFRVLYDPRPRVFALSTGSIYVSTGMLSLVENEAQLAYVLGHEVAHVELNHFYERVRGEVLEEALQIEKERKAKKKKKIFGAISAGVGATVGGFAGGGSGAAWGAVGGLMFYDMVLAKKVKSKETLWADVEEQQADAFGLEAALKRNYDVREAPGFMLAIQRTIKQDPRAGLAFHGGDLDERRRLIEDQLKGSLKAELESKAQEAQLLGSSSNFQFLMASVKRDNGIRALEYDLFEMAKENLEQAVAIRSTDPTAHNFLGKAYRLTARDTEMRQKAQHHFLQAIKYDSERNFHPDPHLELALEMIREEDPQLYPKIQNELKTYVTLKDHQEGVSRILLSFIYDYLSLTGDESWSLRPVSLEPLQQVSEGTR